MKPELSLENNEEDQEIIRRLQELQKAGPSYPADRLKARRAEFLAQIDRLEQADAERELDSGDQEVLQLIGRLKSAQPSYPADLLAARRSAFLLQMRQAQPQPEPVGAWERLRRWFEGLLPAGGLSAFPSPQWRRTSLAIALLAMAAWIGSQVFARAQQAPLPAPVLGTPTNVRPVELGGQTLLVCKPGDPNALCAPSEPDTSPDLAKQGQGEARAAVASDEASSPAANVNDGRRDTSWVSDRPQSWIKLDLGDVRLINSVTLEKASAAQDGNPGQFVIAVSLSDVYSDGDSRNDPAEYAAVFDSEETGFSGKASSSETVRAVFPPVQARFVKITFQKAGAAIQEIGVFMVRPPALTAAPTHTPPEEGSQATVTALPTNTWLPTQTRPPLPTNTGTPISSPTADLAMDTAIPTLTSTPLPSETPLPPPTETATPVPTEPLPTDPPPPTAVRPTIQLPALSPEPILVSGRDQNLIFTCTGNAVEVRGSSNTITLLGSCSSITVIGNANQVFWQFGAPVISDLGNQNIITQR